MKHICKRIFFAPELYVAILILLCIVGYTRTTIYYSDIELKQANGNVKTGFPINKAFEQNELFAVSFNVTSPQGKSYSLRLVPDDCAETITINGTDVSTEEFQGRCDYNNGFVIPSEKISELSSGTTTHYEILIKNRGGNGGLDLKIYPAEQSNALPACALVLTTILVFLITRRLKIPLGVSIILVLGVALRLYFANSLPKYDKFGHDVDGHIAYAQYIADNGSIPANNDCWTCYHPPMYYTAMVPSLKVAKLLNASATSAMNWSSIVLSILILFFGYYVLQTLLKGGSLTLATCLLAFWPTLILSAPRIGNDQMFYLLHIVCLWGSLVYVQKRSGKHLFIAALATLLAYWTKSTAIVSMGIWCLALMLGYYPRGIKHPRKWEAIAFATFGLLLTTIVLRHVLSPGELIGNATSLHSKLKVENAPYNFIFFDIKTFITEPFTSPWHDEAGRQLFWNYSLKTALFGEFKLSSNPIGLLLATLISCSFLGSIAIAIRGFWKKEIGKMDLVLIAQCVAFFAALMYLRIQQPYSCSNDFRYILPVILSFIPFAARGATLAEGSTKWKVASSFCIATFIVCSIVLMLKTV